MFIMCNAAIVLFNQSMPLINLLLLLQHIVGAYLMTSYVVGATCCFSTHSMGFASFVIKLSLESSPPKTYMSPKLTKRKYSVLGNGRRRVGEARKKNNKPGNPSPPK